MNLNAIIGQQDYHPIIFKYLMPDCKPIVVKQRPQSRPDHQFMQQEVNRLLREGKTRKSDSPWRVQPLVVQKADSFGKRMVIDYSMTIIKFTLLYSYPLPKIENIISKVAKFKVISSLDLRLAYHQIPLNDEDIPYTAFQVGDELHERLVLPFRCMNWTGCLQCKANDFIK